MELKKPLFQHDCTECVYLGRYNDGSMYYDLYVCDKFKVGPSVIARYNDDGRDYLSCRVAHMLPNLSQGCLIEAKKRAEELNNAPV